ASKRTNASKREESVARLAKLVDEAPLEELAARQRPNSRQRAEAAQQVGLWLVARECLATPAYRAVGDKLAQRAIAAAQREVDPAHLTSILYERGRLALDAGDRQAAERGWSELINVAIVQPRAPRSSAALSVGNALRGVPSAPLGTDSALPG